MKELSVLAQTCKYGVRVGPDRCSSFELSANLFRVSLQQLEELRVAFPREVVDERDARASLTMLAQLVSS